MLLSHKQHFNIYYFAIVLMAASLPLSIFTMNVAQFILFGNWIIEGDYKYKLRKFWNNKVAVSLVSIYLLHLIGLCYTSDFAYGFHDLKIKLPLLSMPIILSSSMSISKKQFDRLMYFFIAAVVIATIICMGVYYGVIHSRKAVLPITDIRKISIFVSHIRFGLFICIAIFALAYYSIKNDLWKHKILAILLIIWLFTFLTILQSLNAIVAFVVAGGVLLLYYLFARTSRKWKVFYLFIVPISITAGCFYLKELSNKKYTLNDTNLFPLEKYTAKGNTYHHDTLFRQIENGNYVFLYICDPELEVAWNKRSKLKFNEKDRKGNELKYTLYRFLTSKNYKKDEAGLNKLTDTEINLIENGVPNKNYQGGILNIKVRILQVLWEINDHKTGGNASGHSLTQRFEYWKTALTIIKEQPLIGVGTGDVKNAFDDQYSKSNSPLSKEVRFRAHNQYLTMAVAFGLIGMIWFLIALFYPLLKHENYLNYFYITFFIIFLVSMLTEDTLETIAGLTFFTFFSCLFLFLRPVKTEHN